MKRLEAALRFQGRDYLFLGQELGGRPLRPDLYDDSGKLDYALVKQLPEFSSGIARLLDLSSQRTVAILCSEEDPLRCHRKWPLAPALVKNGVQVLLHIVSARTVDGHRSWRPTVSGSRVGRSSDLGQLARL